jgi:hypothetical protein
VLLAHSVPYHIIIGEGAPALAYLCGFAERCGVEVAEDLVGYLGGEGGDEVDSDEVPHGVGEVR